MSGGVFAGMNNAIMGGLNAVLAGQASVYGTMISVIMTSSFTAFIIYKGYQTIAGKLQTPVPDVVWDATRLFLILMFVLNLGGWLDIAASAINGLKDGVSGNDNIWALLDTTWEKAQKLGSTLYDKDDSKYFKFEGGLAEGLVWGGAILLLTITTAVNLLAEVTILLMTTTAPIFIFCLSYGFLKPMFNNWLGTIFTAILTIMFSALSVRISVNYLTDILSSAIQKTADSNMVTLAAQTMLAAIGAAVLVWFSAKIATALSGVSVQAVMQGMAAAGVGAGLGAGVGAAKNVAPAALKAGAAGTRLAAVGAGQAIDAVAGKAMDFASMQSARLASIQTMKRMRNPRIG